MARVLNNGRTNRLPMPPLSGQRRPRILRNNEKNGCRGERSRLPNAWQKLRWRASEARARRARWADHKVREADATVRARQKEVREAELELQRVRYDGGNKVFAKHFADNLFWFEC